MGIEKLPLPETKEVEKIEDTERDEQYGDPIFRVLKELEALDDSALPTGEKYFASKLYIEDGMELLKKYADDPEKAAKCEALRKAIEKARAYEAS